MNYVVVTNNLFSGGIGFNEYSLSLICVTNGVISDNSFAELYSGSSKAIITDSDSTDLIISNNSFVAGSPGYSLLVNAATYTNITNNIFSGGTFTTAPLISSGDFCYVAFNNLSHITMSPADANKVDIGGSVNSIDYMNKGAYYYSFVPMSNAIYEVNWGWNMGGPTSGGALAYTGTPTNAYATLNITNSDVPTNASIISIEVGYYLTGSNTDLTFQWTLNDASLNRGSATNVSSALPGVAGAGATTIILTNTALPGTKIYVDGDVTSLVVINGVTGAGDKIIYGAKVKYTI
jgi:hypothetical protein